MPGLMALQMAGPDLPQVPAGLMADPNDFTQRYNTQLSTEEESAFQMWLKALSKKTGRDMSNDMYDYDLRGAFKAGSGQAANGHFPDQFKKPNHPTFSTQSQYSGVGGLQGGEWAQGSNGKWTFKASPAVLKFHSPEELQKYFQQREPDSKLVLPGAQ